MYLYTSLPVKHEVHNTQQQINQIMYTAFFPAIEITTESFVIPYSTYYNILCGNKSASIYQFFKTFLS